jgi:hypothetical protein
VSITASLTGVGASSTPQTFYFFHRDRAHAPSTVNA